MELIDEQRYFCCWLDIWYRCRHIKKSDE